MTKTKFIFWDVQHGNATYINTSNNKHIVVDLGTGSNGEKTFSPLLHLKNNYSVKQLESVIVSHPHCDHIDDILNFDELQPKTFSRPRHLSKSDILDGARSMDLPKLKKYVELDKRYNLPVSSETNPLNTDNLGGLEIKMFAPKSCATSNLNNQSLITVFVYRGLKVVIPGDNESCSFNELMKDLSFQKAIKNADVLLAPHHGRDSGFHNDFVSLVNPRLTIVSDGRFGDTSATSRYSAKSRGWKVHSKSKGSKDRKVLTTRNDGVISVEIGIDSSEKAYLSVNIS